MGAPYMLLRSPRQPLAEVSANVPELYESFARRKSWYDESSNGHRSMPAPFVCPRQDTGFTARAAVDFDPISGFSCLPYVFGGKAVVFEPIPDEVTLEMVLHQVRGGLIEKARRLNKTIIIQFVDNSCAQKFHRLATFGQFVVNGQALVPQPLAYVEWKRDGEFDQNMLRGATRALKLSRVVDTSKGCNVTSKVNIAQLKQEFERYGLIVRLQPMFAKRRVAFAIYFERIQSAVRAKASFAASRALFSLSSSWQLEYLPDTAEQPLLLL